MQSQIYWKFEDKPEVVPLEGEEQEGEDKEKEEPLNLEEEEA